MSLVYQIETNLTSYASKEVEEQSTPLASKVRAEVRRNPRYSQEAENEKKENGNRILGVPMKWTAVETKSFDQHQDYLRTLLLKEEARKKLFFNMSLSATKAQLKLLKSWCLTEKELRLLIHIIACQWKPQPKNDGWVSLPCDFFEEFNLMDVQHGLVKLDILEKTEHINRGNYGTGQCARFRLPETLLDEFIAAGTKNVVQATNAIKAISPEWAGKEKVKQEQKQKDYPKAVTIITKLEKPFKINAPALLAELKALAEEVELAKIFRKPYESLQARLQTVSRCVGLILSQSAGSRTGIVEYQPTYIQKEVHLRSYEMGGGFQNLPKRFKEAALSATGQANHDFKSCHADILRQMAKHVLGKSCLDEILKTGSYPLIGTMVIKSSKTAFSAVANNARTKGLKVGSKQALAQIVAKDPNYESHLEQYNLNQLMEKVKELAEEVKAVGEYIKKVCPERKAFGRGMMSREFQTIEQKALKQVTGGDMVANEHDGWVGRDIGNEGQEEVETDWYGVIKLKWVRTNKEITSKEQGNEKGWNEGETGNRTQGKPEPERNNTYSQVQGSLLTIVIYLYTYITQCIYSIFTSVLR